MPVFHYKCIHIPTNSLLERTIECENKLDFLIQLNELNRQATLSGKAYWIYWAD